MLCISLWIYFVFHNLGKAQQSHYKHLIQAVDIVEVKTNRAAGKYVPNKQIVINCIKNCQSALSQQEGYFRYWEHHKVTTLAESRRGMKRTF